LARLGGFERLTGVDEALTTFLKELRLERLALVQVPLQEALERVLAEDAVAERDLPPFDRSAVDGYALRAKDTFEASQVNLKFLKRTKEDRIDERKARQMWTGHPTPSLLMFYQFVRQLVLNMAGRLEEAPFKLKATTTEKMFAARGRRTFVMVKLTQDKSGRLQASPIPLGLSGAITTLAKADGFVEIHESQQFVGIGDEVTVHLFKPLYTMSSTE